MMVDVASRGLNHCAWIREPVSLPALIVKPLPMGV